MSVKTFVGIIELIVLVAVVVGLIFGGIQAYAFFEDFTAHQKQLQKEELKAQRQFVKLANNMARSHTKVVNSVSTLEAFGELNKEKYNKLMKIMENNDEKLTNVGKITSKMNENVRDLRVASDHTYKEGTGDYNEQYVKKVMYRNKKDDGTVVEVPIAMVWYYPNRPPEKRWKTVVYPLEYFVKVVQAEQQDGQMNTYVEVWFENNKDKASRGKEVPVDIENAEFVQKRIEEETFRWWAPHLNLHLDAGVSTGVGLGLSISGYGKTDNDLRWKFAEFGFGTDGDEYWGKIVPFSYNIGRHVPLISNTFIGPFYGVSTDRGNTFGLTLSIPF